MKSFSIAIFGSFISPNFDKYSDKDLLIVSDSYLTLNNLKEKYESKGYSVSTYTYKKLQYLSEKGSLFIQHLKKESLILRDKKGLLNAILKNHIETIPSNEQVKESVEYFDFLKIIPNTAIGYAWFCDCFYVGIRNHLILKSASNKSYKFSFLNLLTDLKKSNEINNDDFETLRQLRVLKKNYRERVYEELPSKDYIKSLIKVGEKLNLVPNTKFDNQKNFNNYLLKKIRSSDTNHYFKLRLVEVYYLQSGHRFAELDKIICNPQLYAMKFKNEEFVYRLVNNIQQKNGTKQPFCKNMEYVLI
jgi:hypothetical protein